MKGAVAVMLELALAGARFDCLFFGREELPAAESALTPLLAREPLGPELVVMMEPTDNAIHAGCLGNINATWTFSGRAGHSARPGDGDNAIHKAARGIAALAEPSPRSTTSTPEVHEVVSTTMVEGGSRPTSYRPRDRAGQLPLCAGRSPEEAEARGRADRRPRRDRGHLQLPERPVRSPPARRAPAARPADRAKQA